MESRTMKDSGVEWIAEIPKDWEVVALKHIATLNDDSLSMDTPDDYEFNYIDIGSVSFEEGIHSRELTTFEQAPSRARRLVRKDDIIISTVRTYLKAIAIIPDEENVVVSTGFAVIRPRDVLPLFLNYAVKSDYYTEKVSAYSYGVAYPSINASKLMSMKIAIPSEIEQQKIASFLDEKTAHTDSILEDTKKSIEYLKAYKQSLITETVTKGLNANVEMKESGIEWINEIPIYWEVNLGKRLFKKEERPKSDDEGVITAFRDGEVTLRKNRRIDGFTYSSKEIGYQGVRKGDLVIHGMDGFAGAIGVSDSDGKSSPVYIVLSSGENINNYYYSYLLRVYAWNGYIESMATGVRQRSTDFRYSTFSITPLIQPPINEQNEIVRFLVNKSNQIDEVIEEKEKLIQEFKSYKKSLIHEYVTGKKEVN